MPEQEPHQTCALRALTLCDGQVLEDPEHALTSCLCREIARLEGTSFTLQQTLLWEQRHRLIERTMAAPPLPLLSGISAD